MVVKLLSVKSYRSVTIIRVAGRQPLSENPHPARFYFNAGRKNFQSNHQIKPLRLHADESFGKSGQASIKNGTGL